MKIGIICAGDRELKPFLTDIAETSVVEKAMLKFHIGTVGDKEVVALFCGVGKVNAALATQILIDTFNVDKVINAGTAGGIAPELKIFDTVVSTEVAYHDVEEGILTDFHPWFDSVWLKADENLLETARIAVKAANELSSNGKIHFGRMVTGESFISDDGRDEIVNKFNPLSVDMETGSIAHVCYVNNIPFIAVRSITDTKEHSGSDVFELNCIECSKLAKDITLSLLQNL